MDKLLKILRRNGMMEVAQLALLLDQSEDVYKRQSMHSTASTSTKSGCTAPQRSKSIWEKSSVSGKR